MSKDADFVLNLIYGKEGIMHFLDIVKFSQKLTVVISNTFESCGYKGIIADVRDFCHSDVKRC